MELPEGWEIAEIGDLCILINGRAFKPSDWSGTGLRIVRIQNLNNPDSSFNCFLGDVESKFLIDNGELLFAWSGTPGTSFGAHIWNRGKAILNQHIFKVLFDESLIDKSFLKYAINQKLSELIDKAHGGVGLRHVTKGRFEQTAIPFPPLNEQKRIVAAIAALRDRTQKAREALEVIPALCDKFRQSVLAAAFRGDLTADWREQNPNVEPASILLERIQVGYGAIIQNHNRYKNEASTSDRDFIKKNIKNFPLTWELAQVRKICNSSFYGPRFGKDEYVVDGVPSIRTTDIAILNRM